MWRRGTNGFWAYSISTFLGEPGNGPTIVRALSNQVDCSTTSTAIGLCWWVWVSRDLTQRHG